MELKLSNSNTSHLKIIYSNKNVLTSTKEVILENRNQTYNKANIQKITNKAKILS